MTYSTSICIIGAGPAGLSLAGRLSRNIDMPINIIEKSHLPFGLVRWGVAPDHPEIRNSLGMFRSTLSKPNIGYFGNVTFGTDINMEEVAKHHNIVVFCTGMQHARQLEIPGYNQTANYVTGLSFVKWYNGEDTFEKISLRHIKKVAIIGHGNVALDIARILLKPPLSLATTSISYTSFKELVQAQIERVDLLGRRGLFQAAFSMPELREILGLENVEKVCEQIAEIKDIADRTSDIWKKNRRISRLFSLFESHVKQQSTSSSKVLGFKFYQFPKGLLSSQGRVQSLLVDFGRPVGLKGHRIEDLEDLGSSESGRITELDYDLVINSTGFTANPPTTSFESSPQSSCLKFACGWAASRGRGNLADTLANSQQVAADILDSISANALRWKAKDPHAFGELLKHKKANYITKDMLFS